MLQQGFIIFLFLRRVSLPLCKY